MRIYPKSTVQHKKTKYSLAIDESTLQGFLLIEGDHSPFLGQVQSGVCICPLTPENAKELRARLPWLNPVPLGLATSFGFGDRLRVTLSSKISPEDCARLNLGYLDPVGINVDEWRDREQDGVLYVPKAGEMLYRVKSRP